MFNTVIELKFIVEWQCNSSSRPYTKSCGKVEYIEAKMKASKGQTTAFDDTEVEVEGQIKESNKTGVIEGIKKGLNDFFEDDQDCKTKHSAIAGASKLLMNPAKRNKCLQLYF